MTFIGIHAIIVASTELTCQYPVEPFTNSQHLLSEQNQLTFSTPIDTPIAYKNISTYQLEAEANSSILFNSEAMKDNVDVKFEIFNSDLQLQFNKNLDTKRRREWTWTPQKTGTYQIKLTGVTSFGHDSAGYVLIGASPWTLNSELMHPNNTLEIDEPMQISLAYQNKAKYNLSLNEQVTTRLISNKTVDPIYFRITVIAPNGVKILDERTSSDSTKWFDFTPPAPGNYQVFLEGTSDRYDSYGDLNLQVSLND